MGARRLLLIDSDKDFYSVLEQKLSPYGFEIHTADAKVDSLSQVRDLVPDLIIIAVEEPDKVGYSLCNKAKKGVAKTIPVILTTKSVPEKGFNSHRKLKVHADEYIDKRTASPDEVVNKIDGLIELGAPVIKQDSQIADDGIDDDIAVEFDDDIAVEFDDLSVEEIVDEDAINEFSEEENDKTNMGPPQVFNESENIEDAADAAFAALTGSADRADTAFGENTLLTSSNLDDNDATATFQAPPVNPDNSAKNGRSFRDDAGTSSISKSAENQKPPSKQQPISNQENDLNLGLDEIAEMADEEQSGIHDRRALQKLHTLEQENDRLKAALTKATADGDQSYDREREFLKMREQLNEKDKEILDLRDEFGAKDRQILDIKEKLRELEHARAAFDGKKPRA